MSLPVNLLPDSFILMKNIIYITCLLLVSSTMAISQTGPENFREGFLLHRLELASSYADNHLKANYKSIYKSRFLNFSFQNTNHNVITMIIDDFDNRKILVQYTFDSIPRSTPIEIKTGISTTPMEERIIDILEDATRKIKDQYEGNFQPSSTTFYTAIPIISKKENKVIVFSKPIKKNE